MTYIIKKYFLLWVSLVTIYSVQSVYWITYTEYLERDLEYLNQEESYYQYVSIWWEYYKPLYINVHWEALTLDEFWVYFEWKQISENPENFIRIWRRWSGNPFFVDRENLYVTVSETKDSNNFTVMTYSWEEIWWIDSFQILDDDYAITAKWFFTKENWKFTIWTPPFRRIGNFIASKNGIYNTLWEKQDIADVESFRTHNSEELSDYRLRATLYQDKEFIYISKYDVTSKSYNLISLTNDIDNFKLVEWGYVDSKNVFINSTIIEWANPATRKIFNPSHDDKWQFLSERSLYSIDDNHVFWRSFRWGEINVDEVEWADPNSLEIVTFNGNKVKELVKDKNDVYYNGKQIKWSDPATREVIEVLIWSYWQNRRIYAKDKNNVYYNDQIIAGADNDSFEILSFETHPEDYAKDKDNVYFKDLKVQWASPNTFELINEEVKWILKWDVFPIINWKIIQTEIDTFKQENSIENNFFIWKNWVYTRQGNKLNFLDRQQTTKYEGTVGHSPLHAAVKTSVSDWRYLIVNYWYWPGGHSYRIALKPEIRTIINTMYNKIAQDDQKIERLSKKLQEIKDTSPLFNIGYDEIWNLTTNEMLIYQIVNYLDEKIRYKIRSNT